MSIWTILGVPQTQSKAVIKKAYAENTTLKAAAIELGLLTDEQFDQWVRPENMVGPRKA